MTRTGWIKAGAAAASCAAIGAVAGITGSAAAPSKSKAPGRPPMFEKHRGEFHGPPIHSEAVVPKPGGGFETVVGDSGKLKSRSGNDLTITEGTRTEKYKDVTVSIPGDAKIFRNGKTAALDDLKDGDRVHVEKTAERTVVVAFDASFRPPFRRDHRGFGRAPGRPPGGPMAPGGPPPPYGP
jgi:hypothetical protein